MPDRATIERAARALWGEPNPVLSDTRTWRWGPNGSRWVDLRHGTWANGDTGQTGTLDLAEPEPPSDYGAGKDWGACPHWPKCGCGTQSGPHTCEWRAEQRRAEEAAPAPEGFTQIDPSRALVPVPDLPEPPVPPGTNLQHFRKMALDITRLRNSETWLISTDAEKVTALELWMAAWRQVPAGSLPDNDMAIRALAGNRPDWLAVRAVALRGFYKCSDGRLYHPVVAEVVLAAVSRSSKAKIGGKARWGKGKKPRANAQRSLSERNAMEREREREKERGSKGSEGVDYQAPHPQKFSEFDFLSTDGTIFISAAEFAALERELPNLGDMGAIRNAVRYEVREQGWLKSLPEGERKAALIRRLRQKNEHGKRPRAGKAAPQAGSAAPPPRNETEGQRKQRLWAETVARERHAAAVRERGSGSDDARE